MARKTQIAIHGIHIPFSKLLLIEPLTIQRFKVVPIEGNKETIVVFAHELSDTERSDLEFLTGKKLIVLYTDKEKLEELLLLCPIDEAEEDIDTDLADGKPPIDFVPLSPLRKELVPKMVQLAILDGIRRGATQIRFVATDKTASFYYLMDNDWYLVMRPKTEHLDWFLDYFRTLFPEGETTGVHTQPYSKELVAFQLTWETNMGNEIITFIATSEQNTH